MKGKLSWRRDPSATGLARVTQGPRGWTLYYLSPSKVEDWVASIRIDSQTRSRVRVVIVGAYGLKHHNTGRTFPLAEVPEIKKRIRKWVAERIIE